MSSLKIFNTDRNLIVNSDEKFEFSNLEIERALLREKRKAYTQNIVRKSLNYKLHNKFFKIFRRPFRKFAENSDEEMRS